MAAVVIGLFTGVYHIFIAKPASTSGLMAQGAYVWQHRWSGELKDALKTSAKKFDTLYILASESYPVVGLNSLVQKPDVDYKLLASLNRPVCLVVRVGNYSGPFDKDAKISRELLASVKRALSKAWANGLQPCEIQIDFDCAESKLAGYRQWLKMLADADLKVRLSFTALPSWLNNRAFRSLALQADEFVLQIHSFQLPTAKSDYAILCSRDQADRWIWQAARAGRPFRVALPTYSYLVAVDAKGKFITLAAEGLMRKLPKDAVIKRVDSPPDELAELVVEWQKRRPENMDGVIWFRLPTTKDRLNLSQAALDEIMSGSRPVPKMSVELRQAKLAQPSADGMETYDIILKNSGTLRGQLPSNVALTWPGGDCLAADGLRGYTIESMAAGRLMLSRNASSNVAWVAPEKDAIIGWLRLPKDTEIEYEFAGQTQK